MLIVILHFQVNNLNKSSVQTCKTSEYVFTAPFLSFHCLYGNVYIGFIIAGLQLKVRLCMQTFKSRSDFSLYSATCQALVNISKVYQVISVSTACSFLTLIMNQKLVRSHVKVISRNTVLPFQPPSLFISFFTELPCCLWELWVSVEAILVSYW